MCVNVCFLSTQNSDQIFKKNHCPQSREKQFWMRKVKNKTTCNSPRFYTYNIKNKFRLV